MTRVNGIHHLAISTGDMKGQLQFFGAVLGAEVKALYWMHGVPNTFHGFVRLHDHSYVAFVQGPTNASI
ncbi:MAG: VOC family protein, partial [Ilumatobacteraceae bacterium]